MFMFFHGMTNLLNMHLQIGWKICGLQGRSPVIVIGKLVATSLSIDFSCHPQIDGIGQIPIHLMIYFSIYFGMIII